MILLNPFLISFDSKKIGIFLKISKATNFWILPLVEVWRYESQSECFKYSNIKNYFENEKEEYGCPGPSGTTGYADAKTGRA